MTDDIERRLEEAMAARAGEVEPQDQADALARIEGRVNMNRRRGLTLLGAAAAIFVVAGALVLLTRGDDKQEVNVATDSSAAPTSSTSVPTTTSDPAITTTTLAPTTSSTTSTPSTVPVPVGPPPGHVWPLDASSAFATPEEAASSFVSDYLGMIEDVRGATASDESHASVEFFANANGAGRMLVDVVRHADTWYVIGARADQIVVDTPQRYGAIDDPMPVSGQSVAFEAQLGLELRPVGSTSVVATGTAMGGSTEMQPFSTTMSPPLDRGPLVLIVFEGDARGAQTYAKATVVLLGTGP